MGDLSASQRKAKGMLVVLAVAAAVEGALWWRNVHSGPGLSADEGFPDAV